MGLLRKYVCPLCIFTLIQSPAPAHAGSDAKPKMPRVDNYGDPLPAGAVARLGTVRFLPPAGQIQAVALSPDGGIVAAAVDASDQASLLDDTKNSFDTIYLWDSKTGKRIRTIETPSPWMSYVRFIGNGRKLAFAGAYGVRVQDLNRNNTFHYNDRKWNGCTEQIIISDDRLVAVDCGSINFLFGYGYRFQPQHNILCWELRSGAERRLSSVFQSSVSPKDVPMKLFQAVAICPKARYAAIVRSDGLPKIGDKTIKWKYAKRRLQVIELSADKIVFETQDATTSHLLFSSDGRTLVGANDRQIWLRQVGVWRKNRLAEKLQANIRRLQFVGETNILAAHLADSTLCRWDIRNGKQFKSYPLSGSHVTFSKNGRLLAYSWNNAIRIRNVETGEIMNGLAEPLIRFFKIRFSQSDSNTLMAENSDQLVFWNVKNPMSHRSIRLPKNYVDVRDAIGFRWNIPSYEKQIYVGGIRNDFGIYNLTTGRLVRRLPIGQYFCLPRIVAPSGKRVFIAKEAELDGSEPVYLHTFDATTGKQLPTIRHDIRDGSVFLVHAGVKIVPSSKGAYLAQNGKQLKMFDTATGNEVFRMNQKPIVNCVFSENENYLLAEYRRPSKNQTPPIVSMLLLDTKTGNIANQFVICKRGTYFEYPETEFAATALSVDNRLLAVSKKKSSTIQLFEVASGQKRGEFRGHLEPILDLAFSLDGTHLASSSEDRTILVWDLHRPLNPVPIKKRLTQNELTTNWQTLATKDAKKAEASLWSMIYAPKDSIPFLTKHLPPVAKPDAKRLDQLIRDLNGNFRTRSKASTEIEKFGELALPHLRVALKAKNNLEMTRRLQGLLKNAEHDRYTTDANRLRTTRALEVLEKIGNEDARQVLRRLASGAAGAWLTREATAAVERVGRQTAR